MAVKRWKPAASPPRKPREECPWCLKPSYTEAEAAEAILRVLERDGTRLGKYYCGFTDSYHLTSKL